MKHDNNLIFLLAKATGKNAEYIKTVAKKLAEDLNIEWKITPGRKKKEKEGSLNG